MKDFDLLSIPDDPPQKNANVEKVRTFFKEKISKDGNVPSRFQIAKELRLDINAVETAMKDFSIASVFKEISENLSHINLKAVDMQIQNNMYEYLCAEYKQNGTIRAPKQKDMATTFNLSPYQVKRHFAVLCNANKLIKLNATKYHLNTELLPDDKTELLDAMMSNTTLSLDFRDFENSDLEHASPLIFSAMKSSQEAQIVPTLNNKSISIKKPPR